VVNTTIFSSPQRRKEPAACALKLLKMANMVLAAMSDGAQSLKTMQRSKSMHELEGDECEDEELYGNPIVTLPRHMSLSQLHGLEVLKRSAHQPVFPSSTLASMPRTLSNSSLSQLAVHDANIGKTLANSRREIAHSRRELYAEPLRAETVVNTLPVCTVAEKESDW